MNASELKRDFYKRYLGSDNYLYFTSKGILCPLLGCLETEYTSVLCCTLSMGVKMFARRLNGNFVHIQKSSSNESFSYIFGSDAERYRGNRHECAKLLRSMEASGLRGSQILFEYSIPDFMPRREVFLITLAESMAKTSGIDLDPFETASLASLGDNINKYFGIIYSKKGYCTLISTGEPKNMPLPFTGYKIVSVHTKKQDISRAKQIRYAFGHIRKLFPHAMTISDITPEMLTVAAKHIKSRKAVEFMYHLAYENERIETAAAALKHCDTDELFRQMNLSQASMEHYWSLNKEHIFLARRCKHLDGVKAVRAWNDGVIAVLEDDAVDYFINIVRNEFEKNVGYSPLFCVSDVM